MITYILQVILFQILFLTVYDLWLSKETFFAKNRWYLLTTSLISFFVPLIKINTLQQNVPQEFIVYLPEIVLYPQKIIEETAWYQSINYLDVVFYLGILIFSLLFLIKLFKILKLIFTNRIIKQDSFKMVLLKNETKAFSFFNYIFIGDKISESQRDKIIQHELVHATQKHTLDLLVFELLKIVMWFNPMLYIYQKRITLVHEYISDDVVVKSTQKEHYINNILSDLFKVESISFINQFYKHSLIKKRIIMMTKQKSNQIKLLKYLLLIPVLASMLFYVSCANAESKKEKTSSISEIVETQNLTDKKDVNFIVIDKAPTFPGCEVGDKKCFSTEIQKHIIKNFDSKLPNKLGLEKGKQRIFIGFKVDKTGSVVDLKVRAPHQKLEEEVEKIMGTLPKMIPGEHKGKIVSVKYSIPLAIMVE